MQIRDHHRLLSNTKLDMIKIRPYEIDCMFHGQADYIQMLTRVAGKKITKINLIKNVINKPPKVSLPCMIISSQLRFDDILTTFDQDALLNHAAMIQMAINNKVSHFNFTVHAILVHVAVITSTSRY